MRRSKIINPFKASSFVVPNIFLAAFTLLIMCVTPSTLFAKTTTKSTRPNIMIIMADDMGWSDIGCYGSEIKTPVLDKLANNGIRFTQFYNTGRCCPTRASLLTGLYPHQAGIGHMMENKNLKGYQGNLNKNSRTIAEVLKSAGYTTYMSGKWHVTPHTAAVGPKYNWPRQRGFDRFFGTIHGAGSFYDPNSLTLDNTQIPPNKDFFYTDRIADHAIDFLKNHQQDKPFFMYIAFTCPHWPMHARPKNIEKYQGVYNKGWNALRQTRYERQKKMGLVHPDWKLSPQDKKALNFDNVKNKDWEIRLMETYAAMIDCMDQNIGRVVQTLKDTNQFDNTLILFLADNGGCAENMGRQNKIVYKDKDPKKLKPMGDQELQTQMIPKRTRDGKAVKQGRGVMAGPADTYLGYGLSWANASNTPFRRYKHWVHEGGISSPLIAHWPKGIQPSRHNTLEKQPAHLIDLMATCVDLSGAKYPEKVDGISITPMQGVTLSPAFKGNSLDRQAPLFWEHEGNRAIRDGKWKLVAAGPNAPWELYDLDADRTELNNLAKAHPDRVQSMSNAWETWAKKAHVKPWPWNRKKK